MKNRHASHSANRLVMVALASFVVLFIIAASYAFYGERGAVAQNDAAITAPVITPAPEPIEETDTDGDGIPDWEEALWNTDPTKADTDGDGVPDARTTLALGNEDGTEYNVTPGDFSSSTHTATQKVARELFGAYMVEVQQQNVGLSPAEQNKLVEDALSVTVQSLRATVYTKDSFARVVASPENKDAYVAKMDALLTELGTDPKDEMQMLQRMATGDRTAAAAELAALAEFYTSFVARFAAVPVPTDAVELHTDLVNGISSYSHALTGIAEAEQDPIRGAAAIQQFYLHTRLTSTIFNEYVQYRAEHNQ